MTRLMPPHYGIVDGIAFYISAAVIGTRKLAVRAYESGQTLRGMEAATRRTSGSQTSRARQSLCSRPCIKICTHADMNRLAVEGVHGPLSEGVSAQQIGDEVDVTAVPNKDGGQYAWRCTRVAPPAAASAVQHQPARSHQARAKRHQEAPCPELVQWLCGSRREGCLLGRSGCWLAPE